MYAKIIDGVFTPAPKKIKRIIDGVEYVTLNPTGEMLAEQGWKPVIETEPNEAPAGYHYEPVYTDTGNSIEKTWVLSDEITDAAALAIIQGVEE